jgi:hypothetical protein
VMLTKMLAQTTLTTVKLNYLDHIGALLSRLSSVSPLPEDALILSLMR